MSDRFTTLFGRAAAQLRDGLLRISERLHNMLNDNKVLHLPGHPGGRHDFRGVEE